MLSLKEGNWVRWATDTWVKQGQIVLVRGVSFVVEWLGGDRQVFPVSEYVRGMETIPRPPKASSIKRDEAKGVMSVSRAAAILGTTTKRVRARLRDGSLKGIQRDGRWVSVVLDE